MTAVDAAPLADDEFTLSDADFERFCDLFYRRTGIRFAPTKRYFVDKRIGACVAASGHPDFRTWFAALRLGVDHELVQAAINRLTVNETYFLREEYQFDALIRTVLPRLVRDRDDRPIRILSLPCSTGEEPYSIAISLLDRWRDIDRYDVEIVAADIDTDVVRSAQRGTFGDRSLQRLDADARRRWFTRTDDGRWQIDDDLRASVDFRTVNVSDTDEMRALRGFDVAFCRNLLIYFDEVSARRAAENLYGSLRPGGFLFLGHSESMSRISPIFTPVRLPEGMAYQRPKGAGR